MISFWRKIQRQFFSYQKSDRNAIIILAAILLFIIVLNRLLPFVISPRADDFSEIDALVKQWEKEKELPTQNELALSLFSFDPNEVSKQTLDSLNLPAFVKRNILSYRDAGGRFESLADFRKIYGMNDSIFSAVQNYVVLRRPKSNNVVLVKEPAVRKAVQEFKGIINPNDDSYDRLIEFGFNEYQASNLINYRHAGGIFNRPEDVLKIYGVDSALFSKIKDRINIEKSDRVFEEKRPEISIVDLNTADTATLMSLPGIGAVYASRIVKYRDLLGGFYSPQQLLEVYNFPEETLDGIIEYLQADTFQIKKLRINFSDYSELLRHPYLNKQQVEALLNQRQTNGAFKSLEEIVVLQVFDREAFLNIKPYLTCN